MRLRGLLDLAIFYSLFVICKYLINDTKPLINLGIF
nr:MAG TPA: hypothetical protein [Bacteriophage sp.]DAR94024.1 MAG TPA: hypothetical protein [Caudoviricetes sp.]DAS95017.1 MAG TPA: hypothetical protein [Caudoviricetes sp.]DAY37510.1 MAG TPA: hypothetical protein [Caudoviricetes sp.]